MSIDPRYGTPLSPRQLQVLALTAEGWSNKEIASVLKVSEQTVKNYASEILVRLGARSRTEAAVMYAKGDIHLALTLGKVLQVKAVLEKLRGEIDFTVETLESLILLRTRGMTEPPPIFDPLSDDD